MATQLSIYLYRGHRFAALTRYVLPGPRMSIVSGNYVRETSVKRRNKIVQEITRNVANVFSLCNNSNQTCFFEALTFTRSLGRCWKPWPPATVFNTSQGTWRMLMHEKPCLIPILQKVFMESKGPDATCVCSGRSESVHFAHVWRYFYPWCSPFDRIFPFSQLWKYVVILIWLSVFNHK